MLLQAPLGLHVGPKTKRNRFSYHTNGEVVVDDAVGDRISLLLLVVGHDVDVPAVQHHLCAVLDVPKELQQTAAFVTCRGQSGRSEGTGVDGRRPQAQSFGEDVLLAVTFDP